ncbi:uncharacterized protein LOC125496624 [Beta vulgaris subsp. vulgaris]|uniref:uncharacterized protein LOC125496624 n=1 Tax=Beta vulgaris subsp. vulgaris TaxID=3555 RepID=UPI0020372681|nr:uncharacterized protein LOC125496624 [Beta vulgaris subsp. vulgaris]
MKRDVLTLRIGDEKMEFAFNKNMKALIMEEIHQIDTLEHDVLNLRVLVEARDPLEYVLLGEDKEQESEACHFKKAMDKAPILPTRSSFEIVEASLEKEERTTPPPICELKPLPLSLKYVFLGDNETYPLIVNSTLNGPSLDKLLCVLKQHQSAIRYTINDIKGLSPTLCMHRIHLDDGQASSIEPQRRLNPNMKEVVKKEVLKLLEAGIIYPISDSRWVGPVQVVPKKRRMIVIKNDKGDLISTRLVTGWRMCIDYRKLNTATRKDHFSLPFIDQMLEILAGHTHFCFLDGYLGFFQIHIHLDDQEKTTFTCPFGTFAYRRMPFELCNVPSIFQRCMTTIVSDMLESTIEVFMDDLCVVGSSFDICPSNLQKVLERCQKMILVLNWEKCHFMVEDGIVLGHKIS